MRGGREKFDADALAAVAEVAEKDDAALDFFLIFGIGDGQQFAVVHFVFEYEQTAMRADNECLAGFAEFFAIVSASLRLHLHLAEDASAAPDRKSTRLNSSH